MARYTCSYVVKAPLEKLQTLLDVVFQSCNLDVIYTKNDYIMAREVPGKVNFNKLVKMEVQIDTLNATKEKVRVDLTIKNEELPLQVENHCWQIFNVIQRAIAQNERWQLVENNSIPI